MKTIKQVVITLLVFALLTYCADHKIPKADLKYKSFEKIRNKGDLVDTYILKINSDIKIDSLLEINGGTPYLICPLTQIDNFTSKEIESLENYIASIGFEIIDDNSQQGYNYLVGVDFYTGKNKSFREVYLDKKHLINLMKQVECLECKIECRFFMDAHKPYLSNPMCIPVKDVLKALNE